MFPILDRAVFGANFDPNQYVAELVYKPLPGNTATQLNVTLDTTDGFTEAGLHAGEQWQWGFFDLVNTYNNAQADWRLGRGWLRQVRNNMGSAEPGRLRFQRAVVYVLRSADRLPVRSTRT